MALSRAFPLVLTLAVMPHSPAGAQFGGMPGSPAMGLPGSPFAASPAPPRTCQQLLVHRDAVLKHGQTLQAAGRRNAGSEEMCGLFENLIAAEAKMIQELEERRDVCGVPAANIERVKAGHSKAVRIGTQICEVARLLRGPWPPRTPQLPPVPQCFSTLRPGFSCLWAVDH